MLSMMNKFKLLSHMSQRSCQFFSNQQKWFATSDILFVGGASSNKYPGGIDSSWFEKPIDQQDPKVKLLIDMKKRLDEDKNIFKFFGFEETFELNQRSLQTEMRRLQNQLHPDRFVDQNDHIKDLSHLISSTINGYYQILTNPFTRARHLYCIRQKKVSEQTLDSQLDSLKLEAEFLSRMMDTSELAQSPGTSYNKLHQLDGELKKEIELLMKEIELNLEKKNFELVLVNLGKLKFVANCHNSVRRRLERFSSF